MEQSVQKDAWKRSEAFPQQGVDSNDEGKGRNKEKKQNIYNKGPVESGTGKHLPETKK